MSLLALSVGGVAPLPTWRAAPVLEATAASGTAASLIGALPAPPSNPTPSRLLIPRIGVDAAIESRGLDPNRNLSRPLDFNDVAWFNQGPAPGQPGNALINGHVDWWTGDAVFTHLSELRQGDSLTVVRADGTRSSFTVTGSRILGATTRDGGLFAPAQQATVTLITCFGWWDPRLGSAGKRLLVTAALD
jgi:LPXTG-site transpeptidase (sortase) family protein